MSKEKLLGLKRKQQTVTVEGITIIVKEMTNGDAEVYQNSLYKIVGDKMIYQTDNIKAKLFIYTAHDEQGEKMFDIKDLGLVNQLPASVIDKVFQVANDLNNLNPEQVEKN